MVLIDVLDETVTLVTPVLLKVAVFVGTLGGVQLPGVFQSLVAPSQVASWAWAVFGTRIATALKQTLASSAARLKAVRAAAGAIRIALPRIAARGAAGAAARVSCGRPYERIPQPLRAARAALPPKRPLRPARTNNRPAANATGGTGNDQFAVEPLGADCRRLWLSRHAVRPSTSHWRVDACGHGDGRTLELLLEHLERPASLPAPER